MIPAGPGANARRDLPFATEIAATGFCRPTLAVDNDAYFRACQFPITDDREALERSTRMRTRSWCGPGESALTMAERAAAMALDERPELRAEIDLVIAVSATTVPIADPPEPEHPGMADLAPILMRKIGRPEAIGFDLKAVNCAGFLRALQIADAMLANPAYRAALVVASERCSGMAVGAGNRSPYCFILGDGAGAAVLRRRERGHRGGLLDHVGKMDAEHFHDMTILPDRTALFVRGGTVGPITVRMLIDCGRALLQRNHLAIGDVDWLLPMQTHAGLVEQLRAGLRWPAEKLLWNGDVTGFSGSASIPVALAEARRAGQIEKGDLVLSVAVGAGLSSAGTLYRV